MLQPGEKLKDVDGIWWTCCAVQKPKGQHSGLIALRARDGTFLTIPWRYDQDSYERSSHWRKWFVAEDR